MTPWSSSHKGVSMTHLSVRGANSLHSWTEQLTNKTSLRELLTHLNEAEEVN